MSFELQETTLHGHRVAYRMAGSGPPVLLIHGVTSSSANWEVVGPMLARRHTVLAPDLLGHGASAKPRGDYSMGAFASGHASLSDPEARAAFVHTLRASIDPNGQRVRATDRLYLATQLPLLIVWGAHDRIIPIEHGRRAHELVPGSRLEVFEDAGHF